MFREEPLNEFGLVPSMLKIFDFNAQDIHDYRILDNMVLFASLQAGVMYLSEELGENIRSASYSHIPLRKYKCDHSNGTIKTGFWRIHNDKKINKDKK